MTWTARNSGLTGTALNVKYIVQHPANRHVPSQNHILYIATEGGIYESNDGGRSWAKFNLPDPSNAEFGDSPAPTVDELEFFWIDFSPLNLSVMYALGSKASTNRIWVYKTDDIGLTWTSRGVDW